MPSYDMAPVVVTATRTLKEREAVSVPMTVVSARQLQARGAMRLTDALAELPGLVIAHDHGAGVQIQGFDSEYTLILIDGEPVIGRTAGTLDLERLSLSGIERIEIVRGPSSSLYGSDALAGVINIVTRQAESPLGLSLGSRYGTHATSSLAASAETRGERAGVRLAVDRYGSDGYDLAPDRAGATTPAFAVRTADLRSHLAVGDRTTVSLGGRWADERQRGVFALVEDGEDVAFDQQDGQTDWSLHPEIRHRISGRMTAELTLYHARFDVSTRQERQTDGGVLFSDAAGQRYSKAEGVLIAIWNARHLTHAGAGAVEERLAGSRYGDERPRAGSRYVFLQHEWLASRVFHVNASARFDAHDDYASRLSPRLSFLVRPAPAWRIRASAGSGFKAPDFRQRYLSFTNASSGYSVFGATQQNEGLARLDAAGLLAEIYVDPTGARPLSAERSMAYNAGVALTLSPAVEVEVGVFHNDVRDLIETRPIAQKTNGSYVYGYINLNRIYTRGAQLEMTARAGDRLRFTASYQLLQARDRAVLDAIDAGQLFGRTLAGRDYRLERSDYQGLLGRSTHSGTLSASVAMPGPGLHLTLRSVLRSRYGYRDLDGNAVSNLDEEFVTGYALWHATLSRDWPLPHGYTLTAQVGVNNALDVVRPEQLPSQPGRTVFAGLYIAL
ncbi:MAG: TonB-dependent receptor [Rhodothermales bacterium]